MAIYSLSTKPMSRGAGRSAVAASAYRSGTELADERTGLVSDYTRRHGVVHTEIVAPEGISGVDREQLWNAAEAAEKRKDSRVAREYLVALPHELDADQRLALTRELASELVERYGVAVDVAIHAPDRDGDERNHHAHLLATTRRLNYDGLGEKAAIEWSDKKRKASGLGRGADEVRMLRQRWETLANAALERAQVAERVDCRSLQDQGVDRVPQIHVGPMGTEMQRRGTPELSDRASLNLEILATNTELHQLHQLQERAALRTAEREAQEEREWQAWISQPGVCRATGRIVQEAWMSDQLEQSWRESQRIEAAERAAQERTAKERREAPPQPTAQERPRAPSEPSPQERAEAAARRVLRMADQTERASAIREAMRDPDDRYADAFGDQLVELGIGAFGELSPAAQRAHETILDQGTGEREGQPVRHRRPQGPSGPGL